MTAESYQHCYESQLAHAVDAYMKIANDHFNFCEFLSKRIISEWGDDRAETE